MALVFTKAKPVSKVGAEDPQAASIQVCGKKMGI
jgi:hypothetical protein